MKSIKRVVRRILFIIIILFLFWISVFPFICTFVPSPFVRTNPEWFLTGKYAVLSGGEKAKKYFPLKNELGYYNEIKFKYVNNFWKFSIWDRKRYGNTFFIEVGYSDTLYDRAAESITEKYSFENNGFFSQTINSYIVFYKDVDREPGMPSSSFCIAFENNKHTIRFLYNEYGPPPISRRNLLEFGSDFWE